MPTSVPPGVAADGFVSVKFVTAIADTAAPKLATEINAASTVDLSCLLIRGSFSPNAEPSAVTDERLCSREVFEDFGTVKYTLGELEYIIDPQNPASVSNKAYATFLSGVTGFIVHRWGKDVDTEWAVGDKVDVWPVKMGPAVKQAPEANSKLKAKSKPFITGPIKQDVLVVA
jgi:hypothetical protein